MEVAQAMARNYRYSQIDAVVGVARSGIRLGKAVAHALGLPFVDPCANSSFWTIMNCASKEDWL